MLSARRLQNACPQCTAHILRFYVNSFAEISPAAISRTTQEAITRTRFRRRSNNARFLSTSSKRLQEEKPENVDSQEKPDHLSVQPVEDPNQPSAEVPQELLETVPQLPENQDPEAIVRQAKRMFRDTLPSGYLSDEEYKLYERLYGAPLRPTAPEDVGFGSLGETEEANSRNTPKNLLLRKDQHGMLEEVEYTTPSISQGTEDSEIEMVETDEGIVTQPPSDTQLEYITANANNQREYNALLQLQKDFEVSRIRAAQEKAREQKELAEEQEEGLEEEEEVEEEVEEEEDRGRDAQYLEWYPGVEGPRLHKYSVEGQFRTSPSTLFLPKVDFVDPITQLLKRADITHVRAAAEKGFGGRGLPDSPSTTSSRKHPQKGLGIEASHHRMSEIEADAFIATALPGIYASATSTLVEVRKRLGADWIRGLLKRQDGDGAGPRVLDAGAGGAGLSAWQSMVQAEWDLMREEDEGLEDMPPGKKTVIVGSDSLRHRLSRFLENTQFLPRLPHYVHSVDNNEKQLDASEVPQKRKVYDVIIATHLLMPMEKEWRRREALDNLWSLLSPEGGVLIVLEKGHPRGFEAVAEVRQRLLDEFIIPPTLEPAPEEIEQNREREREPGMIVAPCTNHSKCPMYLTRGISGGRKDFCHFSQRFIRPPFLQQVLRAAHRNHEDIDFSFIAVRRGMPSSASTSTSASAPDHSELSDWQPPTERGAQSSDVINPISILQGEPATTAAFSGYESVSPDSASRPHPLSLPRNILPPLKRKGHVTLDLCTPSGTIERWTIPRSFSKQAYHDARKAQWGDLWALGAKTRIHRSVRLGRGLIDGHVPNDGGVRSARAAVLNGVTDSKGRKAKPKARVINVEMNKQGIFAPSTKGIQPIRPERRTKGGRKPPRERNTLRELGEDV